MRTSSWFFRAVFLAIIIQPLHASGSGESEISTYAIGDGQSIIAAIKNNEIIETFSYDPNEEVLLIVQFASPPLTRVQSEQRRKSPGSDRTTGSHEIALSNIQAEHNRFRSELSEIETRAMGDAGLKRISSSIRFEYRTVFNGAAITTLRWIADEIEKLSYVKAIHPDSPVEALVSEAAGVIEADFVRNEYGLTGDGVIIGILDTGIDYTHPALGGSVGPDYKVLGGKNFTTDNRDDFMDRHSHGTHVAGIVAAEGGGITGIAPGARLMAYKVLGDGGRGTQAWVIAGIEQAVEDGVHIMNLSLGGSGNPNDAGSQAIDNAMRAGVLCVIAAGNSADYFTIGSPGTARHGLTVGASDNNNQITTFSSRGPTAVSYDMKPDIVAPGYQLNSAIPGGGYRRFSGTSMAAPVTAGAAALYLEKNPGTDPFTVKSILMNTASNIDEDVWTQGAGQLNIRKALEAGISITSGSSFFGITDVNAGQWTAIDTFVVRNHSGQSIEISLSAQHGLPSGAQLMMQPNEFVLEMNGEKSVILTLTADQELPFQGIPPGYTGSVSASAGNNSIHVPFAFIKSPLIEVTFDQLPVVMYVYDRNDFLRSYVSTQLSPVTKLLLPVNTYDIITLFRDFTHQSETNHIVLKKNIELDSYTSLDLFRTDSKNEIHYNLTDISSNDIPVTSQYSVFSQKNGDMNIFFLGQIIHSISDLSDQYRFDTKIHSFNSFDQIIYEIPHEISSGVQSGIVIENDPSEYQSLRIGYDGHLGHSDRYWNWVFYSPTSAVGNTNEAVISSPFQRTYYYAPPPSDSFYKWFNRRKHTLATDNDNIYLTPQLTVSTGGDFIFYENSFVQYPVFVSADNIIHHIGESIPVWTGYTNNTADMVQLSRRTRNIDEPTGAAGFFTDQIGGGVQKDIPFRLMKGDEVVDADKLSHTVNIWQISVTPGEYTVELKERNYRIKNVHGEARVVLTFDINKPDRNPPSIVKAEFLSDGKHTNLFDPVLDNRIIVKLSDDNEIAEASFYYQPLFGEQWSELQAEQNGNVYTIIPNEMPDGMYYSLRLMVTDEAGNKMEYSAEPAFYLLGDSEILLPAPVSLRYPENGSVDIPIDQLLEWSPSQYAAWYRLQVGTDPGFETPFFDSTGIGSLKISTPLFEKNTVYYWRVKALNNAGDSDWSPVWQFTSGTTTDIEEIAGLPSAYSLNQNFPNPFNPTTTIQYSLPEMSYVKITIYNTLGQEVHTLVDSNQDAGYHNVVWFADVPSGVYFYRMEAVSGSDYTQRFVEMKRLVVLK